MRDGVSRQERTEPERLNHRHADFLWDSEHGQHRRKLLALLLSVEHLQHTAMEQQKLLLILWLWQGKHFADIGIF